MDFWQIQKSPESYLLCFEPPLMGLREKRALLRGGGLFLFFKEISFYSSF